MEFLKVSVGVVLLLSAWLVLFRTGLIFKLNAWIRENVFSDNVILFSRRRMAILLLLLGSIALFSGIEGLVDERKIQPRIAAEIIDLAEADFQKQRYENVIKRCRDVVRSDAKNLKAWRLMAASWWATNQKKQALQALEAIRQIDPSYPVEEDPLLRSLTRGREKRSS